MLELPGDLDEHAVVAAAGRRSVRVYGAGPYRATIGAAHPL
jgi:hypothetical protein